MPAVTSVASRRNLSRKLKAKWADPKFRARMRKAQSEGKIREWADPEKRAARMKVLFSLESLEKQLLAKGHRSWYHLTGPYMREAGFSEEEILATPTGARSTAASCHRHNIPAQYFRLYLSLPTRSRNTLTYCFNGFGLRVRQHHNNITPEAWIALTDAERKGLKDAYERTLIEAKKALKQP